MIIAITVAAAKSAVTTMGIAIMKTRSAKKKLSLNLLIYSI